MSFQIRLLRAFAAISLSALFGALGGLWVGLSIGMFFFLAGALPGAIVGVPAGYVAALLGTAIGGYRAWSFSGAATGLASGVALFLFTTRGRPPERETLVWLLLMIVPPTIAGFVVGYRAAKGLMQPATRYGKFMTPVRLIIAWARLYELPLEWRLLLAAVNLTIAVVGVWQLLLWQDILPRVKFMV